MRPSFPSHSIAQPLARTVALLLACAATVCAQQAAQNDAQKPALPRVTTTVEVKDVVKNDYLQTTTEAASLDGATLKETPLAVTSVSRAVLNDQVARTLTDVVKNDASIGEDYAPVGYYGNFEIRGFPVDLATGLEINGLTIAGEQDVPLENKQSVEVVKGIAGVESGVASSGGLINFVTKRPLKGQRVALETATDHRGTAYGALDAGRMFGVRYEPGVRINVAGENMHTYVQHADGWRGVGAADASLKLDAQTNAYVDFDYQHKVQRSEAGYQLLGGTTVPSPVFVSTMLGYQSWSKPNTFDTFNANAKVTHVFNTMWSARVEGSYSHSLIDDNVIWPYGAALDSDGNSLCPDAPYYFFCPDGSYEIYDYRSPGELRTNAVGAALVQGRVKTGPVTHEIVGGGELFARRVELSSATVYLPLGVENVYQPNVALAQDNTQAGPSALADFNHQGSGIVQDRVRIPGGVSLLAGGRYARVSSFAYDGKARTLWLPQYGATWAATSTVTLYGNYGVLLSLGPQAPWWVDNSSAFLQPFYTRQTEAGVKYEKQILLTASVFRMRQPFFYPRVIQTADSFCPTNVLAGGDVAQGDLCFESDGRETHTGVEANAQGKATRWLQLTASAAALRAHSDDSSTTTYNGKQVINVPRVRATIFADVAVPHVRGLHVLPGWSMTSRKEATRDDLVSVDGYSVFNVGARWSPRGEDGHLTLRLYADNVLNKRYWKDTGSSYGDTFIHQGAPATVRLAAHYTF
ncbi:MAG: TonB-dependent siderophore receptor [Terracidiphilus sp.]|nr:TonB-dependent siderophore receptor [Terracidiphilus sp.]